MAFHDLGAHAEHDALDARLLGLLGDREQRLFERQAGLDQRGELAREQRQIGGGDAAPQREAALALGLAVFDLGDGDRQQLPFAQDLPHVLDGVAFDHAVLFAAGGIEGGVFEGTHASDRLNQSSRVTRRTSSTVVSPRSTLSRPSSRMDGVMRARVALEVVLGRFVVDHGAHLVVDDHQLVDAGAAAEAAARCRWAGTASAKVRWAPRPEQAAFVFAGFEGTAWCRG